ncbi:MAG: hypothetical protein QN178_01755 [Armatimonadota bacterium]|nr:hypothetical protein [Armatimonadota bacterium]
MEAATTHRPLSGSELRRLLELRSHLRGAIVDAPRQVQRAVLQALEAARQSRLEGRARPWDPPAMTRDEIIREVKWRLDAAGLDEVAAAARVLDRAHRRRQPGPRRPRTP